MSDKRLIDANALRQKIAEWATAADNSASFADSAEGFAYDEVLDAIDAIPTIGPEELLSSLWRDSKADPPKEKDTGQYGKVIVWYKGALDVSTEPWAFVASMPESYPYWMPLPEPPKEE